MMINKLRKNLTNLLGANVTYYRGHSRISQWEIDWQVNGETVYVMVEIHANNGVPKSYRFI